MSDGAGTPADSNGDHERRSTWTSPLVLVPVLVALIGAAATIGSGVLSRSKEDTPPPTSQALSSTTTTPSEANTPTPSASTLSTPTTSPPTTTDSLSPTPSFSPTSHTYKLGRNVFSLLVDFDTRKVSPSREKVLAPELVVYPNYYQIIGGGGDAPIVTKRPTAADCADSTVFSTGIGDYYKLKKTDYICLVTSEGMWASIHVDGITQDIASLTVEILGPDISEPSAS